jgi:hypothetical protein
MKCAVMAIVSLLSVPALPQTPPPAPPAATLQRGLAWLARMQKADGSWACNVGFKLGDKYEISYPEAEQNDRSGGHVGVSALACLAFLRAGRPAEYEGVLSRGLAHVLSCVKEDGYITENRTNFYSHALATQLLAETFSTTRRHDLEEQIWMALDVIVKSQSNDGGWGYLPFDGRADIASTTCQMMALAAARNAGVEVPQRTIDRAVRFVRSCAVRDGDLRGAFRYQAGDGLAALETRSLGFRSRRDRVSYTLTAASLASLLALGASNPEEVKDGLRFLEGEYANLRSLYSKHFYFFYGNYFAAQVIKTAGGPNLERYRERIRRDLAALQEEGGSWTDNVGPAFATAMATLTLEIVE